MTGIQRATPGGPDGKLRDLPTLPIAVARLLQLYAREEYMVEEVVTLLETDPAISARVLRLANSAYYGFAGQVDRLHHGLVLLGGVTVQCIALSTTVLRRWARRAPPAPVREVWVHAFLCGAGGRYLGSRLPASADLPPPDAFFVIGLFHDIGKIYFLAQAPEAYVPLLENLAGEDLRTAEREQFGQDHASAGGDLLEAWGLPSRVVNVVRHHHSGDLRPDLRLALGVVRSVHALLAEADQDEASTGNVVPQALRGDLCAHLERERPGAEAFYEAIV